MDKKELSIGLLRDKLREFSQINNALDNKMDENYLQVLGEDISKVKQQIKNKKSQIKHYSLLLAIYDKFRFLNFIYYLTPFALVFGTIALLLSNRGALLLIFSFLALAKFALGKSIALRLRHKEYLLHQLAEKLLDLEQEAEKRSDEREALLARASILAAEIRYLEHFLNDTS